LDHAIAVFSPDMHGHDVGLKRFLFQRMYRHPRVNAMTDHARQVVADLFAWHIGDPARLPADWRTDADGPGGRQTARLVADYIAGMTDKFALEIHARMTSA
jgi:dGTPase